MDDKSPNSFSEFTNLYSLSKTLRFELKPLPETAELLKKANLQGQTPVQVDQEIDELYHKEMKPLFDELHELFIIQTLETVQFNIEELQHLENLYIELKNILVDRKNNQERIDRLQGSSGEIAKMQNKLRQFVCEQFAVEAEKWKEQYSGIKLDDSGYKILTNAKILDVLLLLHPEKGEVIKKFQGFFTYFGGFNQNRENYYTDEAKATGVANRIINENFVIFTNDRQIFEQIVKKIPQMVEYKKYFELENYKNYLSQGAIENFNENIIGKINSEKNLFLQQENSNSNSSGKKVYLPNLKKLYKQIGCRSKQQIDLEDQGMSIYPQYLEKIGLSFQITKDEHGRYEIWRALQFLNETYGNKIEELKQNYQKFFSSWNEYNLHEIWMRKESINTISARWFGGDNWSTLADALKKKGTGKIEKGEYKVPSFVSLDELKQAMDDLPSYEPENLFKEEYKNYFKSTLFETFLSIWQYEVRSKFEEIVKHRQTFEVVSKEVFDKNKKSEAGKSVHTEIVKNLIEDGYLRLYQLTKYHNLEKNGEKDPRPTEGKFYDELEKFWEENEIVTYHKAFQATLTKKPYSENKIKLNFGCGTLLGGWSSYFESYGSLIFYKDNKYYLGIIKGTKFNNTEVASLYENIDSNSYAKRLIYLTQKIDNKNPPRWFIRSKGNTFSPMVREGLINPKDILDIYDKKLYSKTDNKNSYKEYLPKLIDYFKEGFRNHKDFKHFSFEWLDSKEYGTVADFYSHTANMCYKLDWEEINFKSLIKLVQQGRIYIFQIYNKDFELDESIGTNKYGNDFKAHKTTGQLNSHTQLFMELLKPENVLKLKLLGGGEVFFRNSSNEKKYKKDKKGKEVLDAKRYYEQKYFLHFPVELKGRNLGGSYNQEINKKLQSDSENINIIGIDRGEKHLLYYSVVDSFGKMIDKGSLNILKGVDYNAKLQERQNKRNEARLDWEEIGNIKNFKEGYLSQAVHKIYELIIKYNAIVVLENLNAEFKAKRLSKVEKSVYKKFELALARKLNHLILKKKQADDIGGVLNAYQLTPAIPAGDVGKFEKAHQWGIMFYVRAHYTSTTDPLTGWRKHMYVSNSETDKKIKDFFNPSAGVQINFDNEKNCFKFSYEHESNIWHLFAYKGLERYYWNNKERKMVMYNLHEEFSNLFAGLSTSANINQQIYEKDFNWKRLVFLWNLLNQIRNTDRNKEGNENDFIQSPVWSKDHQQFFDSKKVTSIDLPDNGDANGAYNIARKGVLLLQRIKNSPDISKFGNDNKGKNPKNGYYISDPEWDEAVSDWDDFVTQNK